MALVDKLLFCLALLLPQIFVLNGQQVGASLELLGVNLPSDSLVDLRDLLDVPLNGLDPTPLRNLPTLHCFTDLVNCCNAPRSSGGEWSFPNGTALDFDLGGSTTFRRNRGPNGLHGIGGQMVYGVVRLFRRGDPPERGRFRCEVPTAANPTVNQILYVNILNIGPMTITPSGGSNTGIAGTSFSLVCSATVETQTDSPTPNFEWFFGPNNVSVPSGATPMATVMGSGNTYTSTLQFSPLQESHAEMYTCRLGGNARLAVNAVVTVNRPDITVTVRASGSPVLGQSVYSLICVVTGQENLSSTITYQWTRDNGTTQSQVGTNSNTLFFSSLSLSDAGRYTCSVTVSSPYLNSNAMASSGNYQDVIFHVPNPSVTVTSNPPTSILDRTDVTVTCTVEMAHGVMVSDLSLLMVDAQLSRDGTPLTLTGLTVSGTTFIYTIQLNLFGRNDSRNYNCTATVTRLQPTSTYLTGSGLTTTVAEVVVGVYVSLGEKVYTDNMSNILITDIGEGDSSLLCFTGLIQCCRDSDTSSGVGALGRWLYPNGSAIGEKSEREDFYTDRGSSIVRLNRRNNVSSPTGQFCCEVPNTSTTNTRICVNTFNLQSEKTCTSTCTAEVAIAVTGTILIECLLAIPIIVVVVSLYCRKKKQSEKSCGKLEEVGKGSGDLLYEDPDKLTSSGHGNYELTECPAYESTTTKPQPHPTEVDQSSHYEI